MLKIVSERVLEKERMSKIKICAQLKDEKLERAVESGVEFVVPQMQCDQIGRFWKVLGDKISYKSSPNYYKLCGLY